MKALRLETSVEVVEVPEPRPGPGEARLRIHLAGVCSTDYALVAGYRNFRGILGHEFVATVVECERSQWVGRRVVGDINVACGDCPECRRWPDGHHCRRRRVVGIEDHPGAFAEFLCLAERNLRAVPDGLSDEAAVFAEPLAAAMAVNEVLEGSESDRVLVIGDGRLGSLIAQAVRPTGAHIALVGKHPAKLARLAQLGITTLTREQVVDSEPWDAIVEASGSLSGLTDAMTWVRPRGKLVLKTTLAGPRSVDLSPVVVKELLVLGSRCGNMELAVQALACGQVQVEPLIDQVLPLSEGTAAFSAQRPRDQFKCLLDCRGV